MKRGLYLFLAILFVMSLNCPATASAAGSGTLKVSSSPAGADVYLDGVFQKAVTPCEIAAPEGTHTVELKIPGYEAYSGSVSITAGAVTDLSIVTLLPALPAADADHTITVTTLEDKARWGTVAEMDALTVSALKADTVTPISLREAIAAVKNEPAASGHYRIEFDSSLSGGTLPLFTSDGSDFPVPNGLSQNLYIEKRGDMTINGDIGRDGTPDITLDASTYGNPGTTKSSILDIYASNVYITGLAFHGSSTPTDPDNQYGTLGTLVLRVPDRHTEQYDVDTVHILGCTFTNSDAVGVATCGAPGEMYSGTSDGARTADFSNLVFAGNTFTETGLFSFAGAGDEDYNVIDGYTVAANKFIGRGIGLLTADAHSWYVFGNDSGPIEYCSHNRFMNILISGNDITATESNVNTGLIHLTTANLGNTDNLIQDVMIRNNRAKAELSSPDPNHPEDVSFSNVELVNVDCGADPRFTRYTSPACRHNTANNTMRNVTLTDNYFEMGNSRDFVINNVCLGYTEKAGMDATGNRMENITIQDNTIVSTCGARICCVGGDGTRENNDVSGNAMSGIQFERNTLKRNDNGLYTHRGLIIAGFIDQQNAYTASYHSNTLSDVTVAGNSISDYRTGVIVTGSAGNGASTHSVDNVSVSGNTVTCKPDGNFGIIAAGAAISGYGGTAFNASSDCTASNIHISGNTVTSPGGILLAGAYVDAPVKTALKGNVLSEVFVSGNRLTAAAGVPEHMHLPGITAADIAERWSGQIESGTDKAGNWVKSPEITGNDCNGFQWSTFDLSRLAASSKIGSEKTGAQLLNEISGLADTVSTAHLYNWSWDGAQYSSTSPACFLAKGENKTGDGIEALYKSYQVLNEYAVYTVAFEPNGGTRTGGGALSQSVEYAHTVTQPEVNKSSYMFGGWYREPECIHAWNFSTDTVNGNTTLYAKWNLNVTPVGITCRKTDATLYGTPNGSITLTASGGNSGSYRYSIDGGATWADSGYFENIAAGSYTMVARDAGNTSNAASAVVTVGQPRLAGVYAANRIPSRASAGTAITVKPASPPKGYTLKSVFYSSSNKSAAPVDPSGNITFLKGGTVKLTVTAVYQKTDKKGKTTSKTVKLVKKITVNQLVSSISLNLTNVQLAVKKKVGLKATVQPYSATNRKVKWKSSNTKVAVVSATGAITAKKKGTAVITCYAQDGSKVSASCTVIVN